MFPFAGKYGKHGGAPEFGYGYGHGRHAGRGGFGPSGGRAGFGAFGGPGGFGPFGGEHMLHELDLTEDQIEKLAELKAEGMGDGMGSMSQGGKLFKAILHELSSETIDRTKVKDAHKKLQEHRTKVGDDMLDRALRFAEILTPEQRKRLKHSALRRFLGLGKPAEVDEEEWNR